MVRILIQTYSIGYPKKKNVRNQMWIKTWLLYILSYSWNRHQGSGYKSFHLYGNQMGKKKR